MRLRRLTLERYGHFTDRTLAFRDDARLHVVFGPNEAGKSSALAAVTDLLFGMDRKDRRYDFQRDGREMSLAAEIVHGDGRMLHVQRRRAPRKTLFDAAGAHLGEDALAPFLGGLTREVFCRAFGLDATSLRAGAGEMLKSEGEIGESLFAAASGLRGLSGLRRDLETESDAIWAPNGRARVLNKLLERRETARKAIRASEVTAPDWKRLNETIASLTERLDATSAARAARAGERARLTRLTRVAPVIAAIDALVGRRDAFADLPPVDEARLDELSDLLAGMRDADAVLHRAGRDLDRAEADLAAVTVEADLLEHGAALNELFAETGAYAQNRRDLPRIDLEAEEFRSLLADLAVRIGLPDADSVQRAEPSDAAKARVAALVAEGQRLRDDEGRLARDVATVQSGLDALRRQRAERGALADPAPLRHGLAALAPVLAEMETQTRLVREVLSEERAVAAAALRLAPAVTDVTGLAATLPPLATIARFRREAEVLARDVARLRDRHEAATSAGAEVAARLAARQADRAVPSAAGLRAIREARDAAWGRLRAALLAPADALAGAPLAAAISGFEQSLVEADRQADEMARDAQRTAAHEADTRALRDEEARAAEAERDLAALDARQRALDAAWAELWGPVGVVPLAPAEMATWHGAAGALLARRAALAERRIDLDLGAARIESIRPALLDLAAASGLTGLDRLDVPLLSGHLASRLDGIAATWEAARDAQSRLAALGERADDLARQHAAACAALDLWQADWRAALPPLGLPETAGLAEGEAALAAWRRVPDALAQRDNRERRVAGMRRDIDGYEIRARRTLAALGRDMPGLSPDAAIVQLHRQAGEARALAARQGELATRRDAALRARDEAEANRTRIASALDAHAAALGVGSGLDPAALAARLNERRGLDQALAARRTELATLGEFVDEAVLRADLADLDAADVELRLARIALDETDLEREGQRIYAERLDLERRRAALEVGVGAEIATAQKRGAELELREAARRWAVLRLGAVLLAAAIDRHRTGQQDPLVARAGALFGQLTGGAFAGLAQDYDESDVPRLAGARAEGGLVPVTGLSEGTRDQLYLALRLAYLEDYAARAEPAPFIGDDLFSTFDDARTIHGLSALAAIGPRIQPILFTHHRHVADLALAHLGDAVDIVGL